ncbi:MAG: hypothetical protein ACLFO6_02900 [Archaeoglobaceae archaeon]
MRVWLGDFEEVEAKDLSTVLEDIGVKTTIESPLVVDLDWYYYVEDNFSQLKSKYTEFKDVFEEWELYLKVMRSILVDGMDIKDFEESVIREVSRYRDLGRLERDEVVALFRSVLDLNNISYKDGIIRGELPQDPVIRAYMEVDDDVAEELDLHPEFNVSLERANNLYADIFDAAKSIDKLRDLCEERPEIFELFIAADSIASVLGRLDRRKDINEFMEDISVISKEGAEISLSKDVTDDILNSLNQEGFIKIEDGFISRLK